MPILLDKADTTTDPWVVQMPRGICPYAVNVKRIVEETMKDQHTNSIEGHAVSQNRNDGQVRKVDQHTMTDPEQPTHEEQGNDGDDKNEVLKELRDDGNECCEILKAKLKEKYDSTLKEVVESYEKEIDQLKRQHRKSIVHHVKMERSYQEKIKELQVKCDDLIKDIDMMKNSEQERASEQGEVEEAINEQLDNEEVQHKEMVPGTVRIELIKGTELLMCNRDGTSDPYCYVSVVHSNDQKKITAALWSIEKLCQYKLIEAAYETSSTVSCTVDPVWEEYFELPVKDINTYAILIEVWDDDEQNLKLRDMKLFDQSSSEGEGDGFIGRAFLPISMIKCDDMDWVLPVYGRKKKIHGEIQLHVGMLRAEDEVPTDQSGN
ncbi:uncharacterized protein [Dysidea avara]